MCSREEWQRRHRLWRKDTTSRLGVLGKVLQKRWCWSWPKDPMSSIRESRKRELIQEPQKAKFKGTAVTTQVSQWLQWCYGNSKKNGKDGRGQNTKSLVGIARSLDLFWHPQQVLWDSGRRVEPGLKQDNAGSRDTSKEAKEMIQLKNYKGSNMCLGSNSVPPKFICWSPDL